MNWLDITVLCLCGIGLVKGLYDGMIKQIVALGAMVIGIYLCSGVAGWLCDYLQQTSWFPPNAIIPASYFLGFVMIVGIILLAGSIVHRLVDATPLSILNHLGGGIAGIILTIMMISLLFNLMDIVNLTSIIPQEVQVESRFYLAIKNIILNIFPGNLFRINLEFLA